MIYQFHLHDTYKDEFKGMGDWLGTGKVAPGNMKSFKEARAFVRKLKLKNLKEWDLYYKNKLIGFKEKPPYIPTNPMQTYKYEFKGMGDWLGTDRVANKNRIFKSFKEARTFVRKLKLKNLKEWKLYCKNKLKGYKEKPADIPAHPDYYKSEWRGFRDWLGKSK